LQAYDKIARAKAQCGGGGSIIRQGLSNSGALPQRRTLSRLLLFVMLVCSTFAVLPVSADTAKPKLVLLIVADQFSYSYLSRFQDRFGTGGLRALQDRGAVFTNCKFADATTQSAVGHSVISTGAYPWSTGIVADQWYDPGRAKTIVAIADEGAQQVGGSGPAFGTRLMNGTTIGDQMKLSSNGRSKVISVSLEPGAALLLAGRLATNAYWWEQKTGTFVTSSQYGHELPSWVQAFNDQRYAEKFVGKQWQRLMPEGQYGASTRDDYPYERSIAGDGKQFPHTIGTAAGEAFNSSFVMTPWANDMLVDFSKEAIEREALGQHADTDLLAISFSAGGYLGEAFGPYSQESEDLCLRLDQSLANLMQHLDSKIGSGNYMVVFTSDHGVAPIPEFLKERGAEGGRIDPKVFKTLLNSALVGRLGQGEWIEAFEPPNLYLNANTIAKQNYRQPDVEALAAKTVHSIPGIADAYAAFQFYTNQLPSGPLLDAIRKSYYWGRSGELYVVPKPGFIFDSEINGTKSGSPYNYDCQVPLIIAGSGVEPGRYGTSASPADIAATIAAILAIEPPNTSEGRVLFECLGTHIGAPQQTSAGSENGPILMTPMPGMKRHGHSD
jgi:predicted AlkP superfamily pyrophosphatase or phosphodiesterase